MSTHKKDFGSRKSNGSDSFLHKKNTKNLSDPEILLTRDINKNCEYQIIEGEQLAKFFHLREGSDPLVFIKKIREGLPYKMVTEISKVLEINQQELSKRIGVNERTLARRKEEKRLHHDEGDRLYRLIHIYCFALAVFKEKNSALEWLKTPKKALGAEIPLNLLDTEIGIREVENLLGRIEYGVYS